MISDRIQYKDSLIKKFIVTLLVSLLAASAVVVSGSYLVSSRQAERELHERASEYLSGLLTVLKVPVWDLDSDAVELIGDTFFENDIIASLTIKDNGEDILFFGRNPTRQPLFSIEQDIVYRDQLIGHVRAEISDHYLKKLESSYLWTYLIAIAVILITTLLASGLYLQLFLRSSFQKFTKRLNDYLSGNTNAFSQGSIYSEFQPLVAALGEANRAQKAAEIKADTVTELREKIIEESPIGTSIYDHSGQCIASNDSMGHIIGATREQVLQQNFHNIQSWKVSGMYSSALEALEQNRKRRIEVAVITSFGKETVLDCFFAPITAGDQQYLLLVISDLTEHKKMQKLLEASENNLLEAQRIAHVGSWQWNVQNDTSSCSDEVYRIFGRQPQENSLNFEALLAQIHPEDRERVKNAVEDSLTGKTSYDIVYRIIRPDGSERITHAKAEFQHNEDDKQLIMVGTQHDITEQKLVEQQLARKNHELEILYSIHKKLSQQTSVDTILNSSLTMAVELLKMDIGGLLLYDENRQTLALKAYFGMGRTYAENLSQQSVEAGITGQAITQQRVVSIQVGTQAPPSISHLLSEMSIKTGVSIPIIWSNEILGALTLGCKNERFFNEDDIKMMTTLGSSIGTYITNTTLYESVKQSAETLELRVLERTAELEKAQAEMTALIEKLDGAKTLAENKVEELETFCYSISHDLKGPLRGIEGYSQLLTSMYGEKLDKEGLRFLKIVRQSTLQMDQLIEDLLDYSRIDRMEHKDEEVDIPKLIEAILHTRKLILKEEGIDVKLHLDIRTVVCKLTWLRQILDNLIDNAVKFSAGRPDRSIQIDSWEEGGEWIFKVSDKGIGFNMKYHDRIFKIFKRLEKTEEYPGTGVGLAIVKKTVNRMGGRVWADSVPLQGTSFYVALPIHRPAGE